MKVLATLILSVVFAVILWVAVVEHYAHYNNTTIQKLVENYRESKANHEKGLKFAFWVMTSLNGVVLILTLFSFESRRYHPKRSFFMIFCSCAGMILCGQWAMAYFWGPQMADWINAHYHSCSHYSFLYLGASLTLNLFLLLLLSCKAIPDCHNTKGRDTDTLHIRMHDPNVPPYLKEHARV